jgi:hypothetical protein
MIVLQPQELRIGNWVSNGERNYTVDVNMLYDIATNENFPIYPIPLTPEILEACGFENRKIKIDDFTTLEFKFNSFFVFLCQDNAGIGCENVSISLDEVKHLHQLQNLFYALTQTELQIKLPATV